MSIGCSCKAVQGGLNNLCIDDVVYWLIHTHRCAEIPSDALLPTEGVAVGVHLSPFQNLFRGKTTTLPQSAAKAEPYSAFPFIIESSRSPTSHQCPLNTMALSPAFLTSFSRRWWEGRSTGQGRFAVGGGMGRTRRSSTVWCGSPGWHTALMNKTEQVVHSLVFFMVPPMLCDRFHVQETWVCFSPIRCRDHAQWDWIYPLNPCAKTFRMSPYNKCWVLLGSKDHLPSGFWPMARMIVW